MSEPMVRADLSGGARSLLAAYRDVEAPDSEVGRRSWQALRQRVTDPEVATKEAWVNNLPDVNEAFGEEAFDDAHEAWDDEAFVAPVARPGWFHYAQATATSFAIAAAVLLGMRVVVTSATTLSEKASTQGLEAPYQGGAETRQGNASVVDAEPGKATARRGKSVASVAAAETPTPDDVVEQPVAAVPEAVPATPAAPSATKTRRARGSARPAPAATQVDDIAAELALVKQATQAKNAGDTGRALTLLSEHAKRFDGGALAQERQVLRAEVLCARGDKSKAKALAERFAARHPTSALLGRMNGVCAD